MIGVHKLKRKEKSLQTNHIKCSVPHMKSNNLVLGFGST